MKTRLASSEHSRASTPPARVNAPVPQRRRNSAPAGGLPERTSAADPGYAELVSAAQGASPRKQSPSSVLEDHGKDMEIAGFGNTPKAMGKVLRERFPKGPLPTPQQAQLLRALSRHEGGKKWLRKAGLSPYDEAVAYLRAHDYNDWLKREAQDRVWLGYIAWRQFGQIDEKVVRGTPPYNLGRSMDSKDNSLSDAKREEYKAAIDRDLRDAWKKTLASPGAALDEKAEAARDRAASAQYILKRVLLLLHAGLKVYDKERREHLDYTGAVARALSHGGRVNIRIPSLATPDSKDAYALMDWLGVTKGGQQREDIGIKKRSFGTHHLAIGKNKGGREAKFREQGSQGAAYKSKAGSTKQLGLDLAVGGLGEKDFNNDVILPDGAHGHMLIFYRPPTLVRDGGLMIGIETTGPGAHSTVGYKHTFKSSEATSNPESSFGGLKADNVGEGAAAKVTWYYRHKNKNRPDAETNARLVDLRNVNGGAWLDHLETLKEQFNGLVRTKGELNALEHLIGERGSLDDQ